MDNMQKITLNSKNSKSGLITNNQTKETSVFLSLSAVANYLSVYEYYVSRCITNNKPCKGHTVVIKSIEKRSL
jgi:hypothetical protein